MRSLLRGIGFATTKYATAAALLGAAISIGGAGTITRGGPDSGGGGGGGGTGESGTYVGNYCQDVPNLANQGSGELDRDHGTTVRPTNANDPHVVE